jgi:hypothetical protein
LTRHNYTIMVVTESVSTIATPQPRIPRRDDSNLCYDHHIHPFNPSRLHRRCCYQIYHSNCC